MVEKLRKIKELICKRKWRILLIGIGILVAVLLNAWAVWMFFHDNSPTQIKNPIPEPAKDTETFFILVLLLMLLYTFFAITAGLFRTSSYQPKEKNAAIFWSSMALVTGSLSVGAAALLVFWVPMRNWWASVASLILLVYAFVINFFCFQLTLFLTPKTRNRISMLSVFCVSTFGAALIAITFLRLAF